MSEDYNCTEESKKNSLALKVIIVISSFFVLLLVVGHFISANLSNAINLDMVFFAICLFALIRKNLNLAKLSCFCYLIISLISMGYFFSSSQKFLHYLIVGLFNLAPFTLLLIGILILSRTQNEPRILDRNIKSYFSHLDADSKRGIGLITALFALMQFIPHHPHISIVWLLVYIFSIIRKNTVTAKFMLTLWILPYLVSIGKSVYAYQSLNTAIISGMIFLASNGVLLYVGIQGLEQLETEGETIADIHGFG